jgi:hypothetical protein
VSRVKRKFKRGGEYPRSPCLAGLFANFPIPGTCCAACTLFLTLKISRAIVRLDEPQAEFDHGDDGHVHKHRDNDIHAQFWRDGEIALKQS